MPPCDVYSYGMVSYSTIHIMDPGFSFPQPDGYGEIKETRKGIGGEAAGSSIVLAKLGCKVKIDGNWLGDHGRGTYLKELLNGYSIDTSPLTIKPGYRGVEEIVFSDKKTRTVFGTYCNLLFTAKQWNVPKKEDIKKAKVVCLDPFFHEESALAAAYCSEMGKPYVTLDAKPEDPVAKNAAILVISGEFLNREYKDKDRSALLAHYSEQVCGTVIFTAGESDILYRTHGGGEEHIRPFKVTPVDTAGAGDSFRGGLAYGLFSGWDTEKSILFAAALAAMICASFPGVLNAPGYEEVVEFIKESGMYPDFY